MQKYTILVVDNDTAVTGRLQEKLNFENVRLLICGSGVEAIDIMNKRTVDLAFIEVNLPDMKGYYLLKILRSLHKKLNVIILSSGSNGEEERMCREEGIIQFEIKPLDYQMIYDTVNNIIKKCEQLPN